MKMKKIFIIAAILFLLVINSWAQSVYYLETFDNWTSYTSSGWNPDYRYGRDGVFYPTGSDSLPNFSTVTLRNGRLEIQGRANPGVLAYNNYWVGRTTKFVPSTCPDINKSIKATAEHPFGIQVVRYFANIDSDCQDRSLQGYHRDDINIWMIQNEPSKTNEWDTLDYYVYFMELVDRTYSWGGTPESSRFGYFSGSEFFPDVSALQGPDSSTYNFDTATWHWQYNDRYYGDTDEGQDDYSYGILTNSLYYGESYPVNPSTNRIGIRMTHDGSKIKIYLNPNPDDTQGPAPNSYFLLGEINVSWSSNLAVMFGHENLYFHAESEEAKYDNFLIRTVASNAVAEISPIKIRKGTDINFTLELKGEFSTNDSGIGEIKIVKPAGFGLWNYANINVYTNDIVLGKVSGSDANPASGSVALITNGSELKIRFNKTSGVANDIIDYYNNKNIKINFTLQSPAVSDATGKDFVVYVNNEKYSDTGGDITLGGSIRYATTGWQRAVAGDVSTNINTSILLVKIYNDPAAYAGITAVPTPVYEDNSGTSHYLYYYEVSTTGISDSPDISKITIHFPTGINISNVFSLLILDDSNNIKVSNNNIIVDYYADSSGKLPSPNGYDRITIDGYGTPDLPINTLYSNYYWTSEVSSENIVIGSSNEFTTTNSTYPSQKIKVIVVSPVTVGSIDLTNGVGVPHIANSKKTNGFKYTILNNGTTTILKSKIIIPDVFTNVFNISSSILGTNVNFIKNSNILYLDYYSNSTNIPPTSIDEVRFVFVHNRTIADVATNVPVKVYSDNGNTEGWIIGETSSVPGWSVDILPPDPSGQSYITTNIIYTTLSSVWATNQVDYYIYNNGAVGNNIGAAKIVFPTDVQLLNAVSSHISDDATKVSISGNEVILSYTNDINGVVKSYIEIPTEKDVVTVSFRHTITSPTNFTINCKVQNTAKTDWASTTVYPGKSKNLSVEYPYVNAAAYVSVDSDPINNIIDSSTVTNNITCVITNAGREGNRILQARIFVPVSISTNILNITSSKILADGSYIVYDKTAGVIYINYKNDANGPLLGTEKDTINFKLVDKIEDEGVYTILTKVSNDREFSSCDIYSGKSQSIIFDIPDADGGSGLGYKYIYTVSAPKVETFNIVITNKGKGSNKIKKSIIYFPSIFNNKISGVSSSYLGINESSANINLSSSSVEILYESAGNELDSSAKDIVTITYTNDFSDTNTADWDIKVDNGDGKGYVATSLIPNYTKSMEIIIPVDTSITPDSVYTTSTNINFTYTIHNGELIKSRNVYKARIKIPYPFSVTNLKSYSDTWSSSSLSTYSNYVLLDYSANLLQPAAQDIVSLEFNKVDSVTTNVDFESSVDYNYVSGYRDTVITSGKSVTVNVVSPPSDALTHSYPNEISKDIKYSPYKIYIKNVASGNNYIYQVKIDAPNFITNISAVTSSLLGGNVTVSNTTIFIKYYSYNTNISPFMTDEISFIGYDNVNSVTQGSWIVEVNNTTNITGYTQASVEPGYSIGLSLYSPSYNTYASVSPVNLDSTYITNNIVLNIANSSADSSKINKVKIFIPSNFKTNNLVVSNTVSAEISYNNSYILIDYSASNNYISPGSGDVVNLFIEDNIAEGSGSATWISAVNYSSSGDMFITNNISPGKSITNSFYMPTPIYSYSYNVNEIFTTTTNFSAIFYITNRGEGTHKIKVIKITIPEIFTNGFTLSDIVSTSASNKLKNNNIIYLYYTNYLPDRDDTITFNLLNTNKEIANYNFNIILSNGYNSDTITPVINIVSPPSASISPVKVYSTARSNDFTLVIKNDGSGNKPINSTVFIYLPNIITNVKNIASSQNAGFYYTGNRIVLDYSAHILNPGDIDDISFTAMDSITLKDTNVIFYASTSNSIGVSGFSKVSTNSTKVEYYVPAVDANGWIEIPEWVVTTKNTNDMIIKIKNNGTSGNDIKRAVISFPTNLHILTNTIRSTHLTNKDFIKANISVITMYYSSDTNGNGSLISSKTDTVSFQFSHFIEKETNVYITILADNGKYFTNIEPITSKNQSVSVRFPDEDSKFHIKSPDVLYTIETNASIIFTVINNSYLAKMEKLYINFNTNILKVESVESEASNTVSYVSNYLVLTFKDNYKIGVRNSKNITLNVKYHYSGNTNFNFFAESVFEGNGDRVALSVPPGETNELYLLISDFGKISGSIQPKGVITTVEVLNSANENITNKYGKIVQASVNIDTGVYVVNYVPAGNYKLRFTSKEYRDTYYNNVTVNNNQYTYIPEVKLRNRILNNDENDVRTLYADDSESYISFPVGSVLNDFYLDIYKKSITSEQVTAIGRSDNILSGNSPTGINVFNFVLQDKSEENVDEIEIGNSVTIVLHYTDGELSAQGWSEDTLAIFYYKNNTKQWIRLGGTVDKEKNTVTVKVNYVHNYYVLFGAKNPDYTKMFGDFKCWPRQFSPTRGGTAYQNLHISFTFKEKVDGFTFSVYTISGSLVYRKEYTGEYWQGEIYWDGKDSDGYILKSGIYIYQIEVGDTYYRGSVLIMK